MEEEEFAQEKSQNNDSAHLCTTLSYYSTPEEKKNKQNAKTVA